MTLEVEPPSPPRIVDTEPTSNDDDQYLRGQIQLSLEDGAWEEAFSEWAADTEMDAQEFAIATDLGLFEQFDFFWDDFATRVGYNAPGIPEDWKEREYHRELSTWKQVSSINAGLAELGQVVCDVLKERYLDVEVSDFGEGLDLPDFE